MSVQAIIKRIREDAERAISTIKAEETCEVEAIRAKSMQRAEDAYNHRMAEGLREIRQYIARSESKSRILANRIIREAKEELLSQCFADVLEYLKTIRSRPEYPQFLFTMLEDSARNLGHSQISVKVHRDDRSRAEEFISIINNDGFSLFLSDESVETFGGVICERLSDGVTIDNTVEVRFVRLEREMMSAASRILFQNGEP